MKRIFVIVGHRVRTDARFNLNDLCGSTGRLDILLRSINSAFVLSNGIRNDVELFLVLQGEPNPAVSIRLVGEELKYLNPDERSTGALIRQALLIKRNAEGWKRSTPGIYVSNMDFPALILELIDNRGVPVYLHEEGAPLDGYGIPDNAFFVLGDQYDLTEVEEEVLGERACRISLGPEVLHTDHCIVVLQNTLDRCRE